MSARAPLGDEPAHPAPQLSPETAHLGRLSLLDEPLTALFCSQRCPGDLVLKTYDLARAMRDAGVPVIGGFQTPMERECLRLLLRGVLSDLRARRPSVTSTRGATRGC